jgi:single-stranded-DNA-specific exonuclease
MGISLIRQDPLPGIHALCRSASRNPEGITSTDLAYYIAPRLNACGRIGHANDALALLLAGDSQQAESLVSEVEKHNRERRRLDREVEDQVVETADSLNAPRYILMADSGWHRGVIGIVASRLVARYGVPSLMISLEDGTGFGSARSVPGIHIHSILSEIHSRTGIMDSLGGHPMAAGFRIPTENIKLLRRELDEVFSDGSLDQHLGSVLYLDGSLEEDDYNAGTVRALDMLEPFGEGNRKPVWLTRGAYPVNWRTVGKDGSHLSCNFRIGSGTYRAIGFGMANRQSILGGRVDLAFTLALDTWRNDGSIQLILKAIRKHGSGGS